MLVRLLSYILLFLVSWCQEPANLDFLRGNTVDQPTLIRYNALWDVSDDDVPEQSLVVEFVVLTPVSPSHRL